jgi:hypothetical protein
MSELIGIFMISHYLMQIILMIVLTGTLVLEFFNRSMKHKGKILPFAIVSVVFGVAIFHDMYRYFSANYTLLSFFIYGFFYIFLVGLFAWNSSRVWHLINRPLFFASLVFGSFAIAFFIIKFFTDISEIWNLFFWELAGYGVYFTIINLLIKL